ncbi:hypothetical protein FPZ54_09375 [Sphingomonas suaedae]|uniref:Uncharacterized protein n=1 Tax=Sphingomonas suaedae TaxID=2599297 RepID=A0A518RFL5_9SPHN|nr:hypothetical protein [Sphingomonas suaedae]QDX26209.1 hypothetical protein FPZ54_09375 [Sphingomonas suaedae]
MRNTVPARLVLAIAATALSALPAGAMQDKRVNLSDNMGEATPAAQAVETLALGYRLADHARSARDARAMIVAARMLASAPVDSGERLSAPDFDPAAQALFTEAATLAAGDAELRREVEGARAEESRGTICKLHCAIRNVHFVPAGTNWRVRFAARGGEPLVVGVRRDSATGMDLKIYDENDNLVCQDLSQNVTLYCRVTPIWSGPFFAVVTNHGERDVRVAMVAN